MIEFFIEVINPIVWVLANVILAYTALILVVFVFMYYALFNPKATTGGQLIFRFMVSLVGVVGVVFLGIFIDPAPDSEWFIYPAGVFGFCCNDTTRATELLNSLVHSDFLW